MRTCKTGCGCPVVESDFCSTCSRKWQESGEYDRANKQYEAAKADFANRIRAERQNGGAK